MVEEMGSEQVTEAEGSLELRKEKGKDNALGMGGGGRGREVRERPGHAPSRESCLNLKF